MTNVPTLGFVVLYVMILAIVPFLNGLISSLILFKNTKTSIIAGLSSVFFYIILMKLSFSFFVTSLIAAFISCVLIGIALYSIKKWDIPVINLNITEKLSFINRRTINILIVVVLLFFVVLSYGQSREKEMEFSVTDPRYDIEYQGMPGAELSGYEHIDIVRLDSKIVGDSVVLEMELAGNVSQKENVDYNFFVFISRYSAPSMTISKWEMEKEGNILRGYVPLEIAENGQIFYVQAAASESDFSPSQGIDGIYDSCSKKKALGGAVESLDSSTRLFLIWLLD
ncbi:MAG: hypothetical protein PWQ44_1435 [Methanolobus sp.]|nr:hypothetical protein [Methanolobus sp.]